VDVLDAAAVRRGERLHAAVRVEAPGARGQWAVARDFGELACRVILERLVIEGDGGMRMIVVVAEGAARVREQVGEGLREREALHGEVVVGLGELAGGVVAVREVQ